MVREETLLTGTNGKKLWRAVFAHILGSDDTYKNIPK